MSLIAPAAAAFPGLCHRGDDAGDLRHHRRGLTTVTIYYMLQAFPLKLRPLALVCGIGFSNWVRLWRGWSRLMCWR